MNQLCYTGNYTQYFAITYKGKESEKKYIYMHVQLHQFRIHLKLKHCKPTILQLFKKERNFKCEKMCKKRGAEICLEVQG